MAYTMFALRWQQWRVQAQETAINRDLHERTPGRRRIVAAALAVAMVALTACEPKPSAPPQPKAQASLLDGVATQPKAQAA